MFAPVVIIFNPLDYWHLSIQQKKADGFRWPAASQEQDKVVNIVNNDKWENFIIDLFCIC